MKQMPDRKWDVFISHASEDKDVFVRPLARALSQLGVKVWYDEFSLEVGDSLARSIDEGLAGSRYGIVVISPSFMQKRWPERELRGLVQREVLAEEKLILPIWFGVTQQEVVKFSPPLADAFALDAIHMDAEQIALSLLKIVRPDVYRKQPRSDLQKLLTGEALRELQREVDLQQLQTFVRISSIVAPDLKETVVGLSIMTKNIERHFDKEEFRADLVKYLINITARLSTLAGRLSHPVVSPQGSDETVVLRRHRTDVIAVFNRVLDSTVPPDHSPYELEIRFPPSLIVVIEEPQLESIIENLVINALEAIGSKGGRLTIEAGQRPNEIFFSVRDTGIGMSEEFMREKLFRPFMSTKRTRVGLGLYIAREVVRAYGGRIDVESKQGVGTTFSVVFPIYNF
jgi:signal transduction histidine kinase